MGICLHAGGLPEVFPRKAPARECKKRVWKGRGETVMEIQQWLRGSGDDGDQFLERSKTTGVNPVGGKGLRPFCNDRSLVHAIPGREWNSSPLRRAVPGQRLSCVPSWERAPQLRNGDLSVYHHMVCFLRFYSALFLPLWGPFVVSHLRV